MKKNHKIIMTFVGFFFFQTHLLAASQKPKISFVERVKNESVASIKKALSSLKNINQKDTFGNTALHLAVLRGNREIVELLLGKEANFLVPNASGKTAKALAAEKGEGEILNLFRKKIENNRKENKNFKKTHARITAKRPHCCQFYGQLKSNNHILVLVQKTLPNGECSLEGYNPPKENLFFGDCSTDLTHVGCRAHIQNPGICEKECGWGEKPHCQNIRPALFEQ